MAHIHEKIDFTAEVFVVFENKVLLRLHDKYNLWLSVGGHTELHEDPNQAAVREVQEEAGLDVSLWDGNRLFEGDEMNVQLIPPVSLNRHRINPTHEHVSFIYFARATSDAVTVSGAADASHDWKWLTHTELNMLDLRPDVHFFSIAALEKLSV